MDPDGMERASRKPGGGWGAEQLCVAAPVFGDSAYFS